MICKIFVCHPIAFELCEGTEEQRKKNQNPNFLPGFLKFEKGKHNSGISFHNRKSKGFLSVSASYHPAVVVVKLPLYLMYCIGHHFEAATSLLGSTTVLPDRALLYTRSTRQG